MRTRCDVSVFGVKGDGGTLPLREVAETTADTLVSRVRQGIDRSNLVRVWTGDGVYGRKRGQDVRRMFD